MRLAHAFPLGLIPAPEIGQAYIQKYKHTGFNVKRGGSVRAGGECVDLAEISEFGLYGVIQLISPNSKFPIGNSQLAIISINKEETIVNGE